MESIQIIQPTYQHAEAVHNLIIKSAKLVESMDMEEGAWQLFCDYNDQNKTKQRMSSKEFVYWIAVDATNKVLGVLVLAKPSKLNHLFVDPAVLRRGVASQLWDSLKRYCKEHDIVTLCVNASSYAVPIYERWGFESSGQPEQRMGITCYPMTINF